MWPITSDKLLEVEFIAESSVEETKNNSNSAKDTKVSTKNGNALPSPVVKQAFDALENCFNKTNAEPHIFWMKYVSFIEKFSVSEIFLLDSQEI